MGGGQRKRVAAAKTGGRQWKQVGGGRNRWQAAKTGG